MFIVKRYICPWRIFWLVPRIFLYVYPGKLSRPTGGTTGYFRKPHHVATIPLTVKLSQATTNDLLPSLSIELHFKFSLDIFAALSPALQSNVFKGIEIVLAFSLL